MIEYEVGGISGVPRPMIISPRRVAICIWPVSHGPWHMANSQWYGVGATPASDLVMGWEVELRGDGTVAVAGGMVEALRIE